MTVTQVAKVLRRDPEAIRDWIRDGRLRGRKLGPVWVVEATEVERFRKSAPKRRLTWVSWAPSSRWHATRRITRNDTAIALCGQHLELTSKSDELRAPPEDADACKRCLAALKAER
jgi:hypothetical protein